MEQGSEVVRTRQQIDLQQEAAQRGLHGFAIAARHDFINARMQRNGKHILHLIEQGRHEEAQALMNTNEWSTGGKQKTKKRRQTREQKNSKREA